MKIFIDGADNVGWQIDIDRENVRIILRRIGAYEVNNCLKADIIHNVWWDQFIVNRTRLERFILQFKKNVLVTASNFIDLDNPHYERRSLFNVINKAVGGWIAPSLKQKRIFDKHKLTCFYQPFFLDLAIFKPLRGDKRKDDLAQEFCIPKEIYKNKIVIGSFQRDSDGKDFMKPKWQKDPDLLIDILKELPKKSFVLLLAGPRRHYVIHQCKRHNIPYWYVGTETEDDDLKLNALNIARMPKLYALTDLYLVTSRSEGGPKAVMEATATKIPIMSTDVGMAGDFLDRHNVFKDRNEYKKAVHGFITKREGGVQRQRVDEQYKICKNILGHEAMDRRLKDIYAAVWKAKRLFK